MTKASPEAPAATPMDAPALPPTPADLTAPIKTVQEAATGFSADALAWLQDSTLHAALVIAVALSVIFSLHLLRRTLLHFLAGKPGAPRSRFQRILFRMVRSSSAIFVSVLGCWLVAQFVALPKGIYSGLSLAFMITGFIQAGLWLREVALLVIERRLARQGNLADDSSVAGAIGVIGWLVNLAVWSIILLALLDNLGVNITALVAGLGIGGLAVGLAAQGIMADLFSALSIVFDKPFSRGDFIAWNDKMGSVERVGLKTSRIRALSGEVLVVSNNQLLTNVIHNYQQMLERRVVFQLAVVYSTPAEMVEQIPALLKEAVTAQEKCRFDRAHFMRFDENGLLFEVVYYYLGSNYNLYMDANQAILLQIMRAFASRNISFALPTRVVHMPERAA